MAYAIVCDQFTRNAFRDTAKAHALDVLGLRLAKAVVEDAEWFNSYKNIEKMFFILPIMHSEAVADVRFCE